MDKKNQNKASERLNYLKSKESLTQEEMKEFEVNRTAVLLLMEDGEYIFKETTDTIEDFLAIYKVWLWLKRKGD